MAGMMAQLHLSKDEILNLSLPEIEGILEGFAKNNSTDENGGSSKAPLKGADAMQFFIDNNGQI